jgi:hypothetical protein
MATQGACLPVVTDVFFCGTSPKATFVADVECRRASGDRNDVRGPEGAASLVISWSAAHDNLGYVPASNCDANQ